MVYFTHTVRNVSGRAPPAADPRNRRSGELQGGVKPAKWCTTSIRSRCGLQQRTTSDFPPHYGIQSLEFLRVFMNGAVDTFQTRQSLALAFPARLENFSARYPV